MEVETMNDIEIEKKERLVASYEVLRAIVILCILGCIRPVLFCIGVLYYVAKYFRNMRRDVKRYRKEEKLRSRSQ